MTRTRTLLAAVVLLLSTSSIGLAEERNEFKTAGGFVDAYQKNPNIVLRVFIKGMADGITAYNAVLGEIDVGHSLFCPPGRIGIADDWGAISVPVPTHGM